MMDLTYYRMLWTTEFAFGTFDLSYKDLDVSKSSMEFNTTSRRLFSDVLGLQMDLRFQLDQQIDLFMFGILHHGRFFTSYLDIEERLTA